MTTAKGTGRVRAHSARSHPTQPCVCPKGCRLRAMPQAFLHPLAASCLLVVRCGPSGRWLTVSLTNFSNKRPEGGLW